MPLDMSKEPLRSGAQPLSVGYFEHSTTQCIGSARNACPANGGISIRQTYGAARTARAATLYDAHATIVSFGGLSRLLQGNQAGTEAIGRASRPDDEILNGVEDAIATDLGCSTGADASSHPRGDQAFASPLPALASRALLQAVRPTAS